MKEKLKAEIIRIDDMMTKTDPASTDYKVLSDRMGELLRMFGDECEREFKEKSIELEAVKVKKQNSINPNDLIGAATNLAGIWVILNHEKLNVISTKALGFVKKLRF